MVQPLDKLVVNRPVPPYIFLALLPKRCGSNFKFDLKENEIPFHHLFPIPCGMIKSAATARLCGTEEVLSFLHQLK
jgi:hypothetical protein